MKKIILLLVSACMISFFTNAQVNLNAGLVAYFPFNGNANDASGNNHHGQLVNSPQLTADRFNNNSSAYLFDGIDDYIRVPDNGAFSTPNFSLVIWFQSHSDNLQNLVGKRDFTTTGGTAGAQYQFFINYSPFPGIGSNIVGNNSTCSNISSSSYLNTSDWICRTKWYCAVVTFDGSRHKVYIDGVLKKNEPTTFNGFLSCSSDLRFGNWWQGDLIPFKGLMDDIRWYNRALNQDEVYALYNNFQNISGQCGPTSGAGFLSPDTVCVNTPISVANTSNGATSYYWNFCVANSATIPSGTNLGNFSFSSPVFCDYALDGNNYFAFVTNNVPGKLVRLNFGNSLVNTPTVTDFGDFGGVIPNQCEGIQLIKNAGRWYAIIVGGQPVGRVVKIDFGASLSNNTPTATNWGNVGGLAYPTDLHVFQDGNTWYGLTINAQTNTITRLNFSSSFNNVPTGNNLGNVGGLNYPTGIYAIKKDGNWHAFVSNAGTGLNNSTDASLTRLDFGTSLLNNPSGINLGNLGNSLSSSRDLTIYQSCNEIFGFVVNNAPSKELVRIEFANSLTSIPSAVILGNTGGLDFPHSVSKIFRVGDDLYSFVTNVNSNTLTRLRFDGCNNASMLNSTVQNPSPITYSVAGKYAINLTIDEGLPTQSMYCKPVVVIDNSHTPLQSKLLCFGDSVLLTSSSTNGNEWSNGSTSKSIYAKAAGIYWVRSSSGRCPNIDSFQVIVKPRHFVNIGIDTAICATDSILLDAGNPGSTFLWQNGQSTQQLVAKTSGLYHVAVTMNGCVVKDSIVVSGLQIPAINVSNDTTICQTDSILLSVQGGSSFLWSPATGLSSTSGSLVKASPLATTRYFVTATGTNGCKANDSVNVLVVGKPPINIGADTLLCSLDSMELDAGIWGANYLWQNGVTTKTILVKQSGIYNVAVNVNGCTVRDTISISELQSPIISLSKDTAVCKPGTAALHASGGNSYSWSPVINLSSPTGPTTYSSPDTTTTYVVTVTNAEGCKAKDSVKITVLSSPIVSIGADTTLCSLDSMVLDAGNPGSLYAWQNGNTSQKFVVKSGGLYSVMVTQNGCVSKDSILITGLASPVVTLSNDTAICKSAAATLAASGGTNYLWFPAIGLSKTSGSTVIASPDKSTKYYVVVTGLNDCSATDSVTIRVDPKPDFTVHSSIPVLCSGDTAILTVNGGDKYKWMPTAGLSDPLSGVTNAYPVVSTSYKVLITHLACDIVDSLTVHLPVSNKPVPNLLKSNDINCFQGRAVLKAHGGDKYLWKPTLGLSDSLSNSPTVTIDQSKTYYVKVTTKEGCEVEDSIRIFVERGADGSGFPVPSAFTPNNDGKNDCFGVKHWGVVKDFSLNLYNRWGELIFQTKDPSKCWNGMYNGILQPADVYVYWIKANTRCGAVFRKGSFALIK